MTSFSAMLANDLPLMFSDGGDDATFTPAAGPTKACHVFIDYNFSSEPAGNAVSKHQKMKILEYLISEIGREVVVNETFTVGTTVHKVLSILGPEDEFTGKVVVT
jgi:hypothetical protein